MTTIDWGRLADRHAERIWRAARAVAPDDDAAWDCVQEAFLTALVAADPGDLDDPVAWLCGVARNHARHAVRSRGRFARALARLSDRLRATRIERNADGREALQVALSRLPARPREAVVLRYFGRMSVGEVARATRTSEAAAKARIHRGLARLRRTLGGESLVALVVRESARAGADPAARLATAAAAAETAGAAAGSRLLPVGALLGLLLLAGTGLLLRMAGSDASSPNRSPVPPAPAVADAAYVAPSPPAAPALVGARETAVASFRTGDAARAVEGADRGAAEGRAAGSRAGARSSDGTVAVSDPRRTIEVRNLADGTAVAGASFALRDAAGGRLGTAKTDEEGRLRLAEGTALVAAKDDGEWRVPTYAPGEVLRDGVVWVYREGPLEVRVKHGSPAPEFVVEVVPAGKGRPGADRPAEYPWTRMWLLAHGFGTVSLEGREPARGVVPQVLGFIVRARGEGLLTALEEMTPGREHVHVDLFRKAPALAGRVVDETGEPLAGARVDAFCWASRVLKVRERAWWPAFEPRSVVVAGTIPGGDTLLFPGATTDAEGRFRIDLPFLVRGRVEVVAVADGFRPVRAEVDGKEETTLVAARASEGVVCFEYGTRDLADHEIVLLDLAARSPEASAIRLGGAATAAADLLRCGRSYLVVLRDPRGREVTRRRLVWNRGFEIDLSALPEAPVR